MLTAGVLGRLGLAGSQPSAGIFVFISDVTQGRGDLADRDVSAERKLS